MRTAEAICYREDKRSPVERTQRILNRVLEMAKQTEEWEAMTDTERDETEREFKWMIEVKKDMRRRIRS